MDPKELKGSKVLEGWWDGLKEDVCFEYGKDLAAVRLVGGPRILVL